jgi:hypothetical protein
MTPFGDNPTKFTGARMASVDAGDVSPDHLHDLQRRGGRGDCDDHGAAVARHRGHQDPRPAPLERLHHAPQRASRLRRRQPRRDGHGPAGQGHLAAGSGRAAAGLQRGRRVLQRLHPRLSRVHDLLLGRRLRAAVAIDGQGGKSQIRAAAMGRGVAPSPGNRAARTGTTRRRRAVVESTELFTHPRGGEAGEHGAQLGVERGHPGPAPALDLPVSPPSPLNRGLRCRRRRGRGYGVQRQLQRKPSCRRRRCHERVSLFRSVSVYEESFGLCLQKQQQASGCAGLPWPWCQSGVCSASAHVTMQLRTARRSGRGWCVSAFGWWRLAWKERKLIKLIV